MRHIALMAATAGLLAAACSGGTSDGGTADGGGGASGGPTPRARAAVLQAFDDCDDALSFIQKAALERVGPNGFGDGGYYRGGLVDDQIFVEESAGAAVSDGDSSAPAASVPVEGEDFSGTNVQEADVDEPDVVKTDGERMFVAVDGSLYYVDVTGETPVVVSTLSFDQGYGQELLLEGDRVFVLSSGDTYAIEPLFTEDDTEGDSITPYPEGAQLTVVQEVDVSNPERMTVESTELIEGQYLTARVVDGVARVVVSSSPQNIDFVYASGPGAEEAAEAANRELIQNSTIDDWIPSVVTANAQGQTEEDPLVDCGDINYPEEFSGFGLLTVVSVDLGAPLDVGDAVSVMADGTTVYSSTSNLYVATDQWIDPLDIQQLEDDLNNGEIDDGEYEDRYQQLYSNYATTIHRFDVSGEGAADYEASGSVPGRLLNQFAMSEYDDVLRVATTVGGQWDESSESFITTLGVDGEKLVALGEVGEMGRGEEIQSVRFIGDQAYVVTFRQTDPLYTVDLSDPANPAVTGELKILGYSAYLHPIGEDRLIGVGQDADEEGRTRGTQISLFDISDPANPTRIQQLGFDNGSSEVEWDYRAFTWWADTNLAVIPLTIYNYGPEYNEFYGAVGLTVGDDGIVELGRADHGTGEDCLFEEPIAVEPLDDGTAIDGEPTPPIEECYSYSPQIIRAVVMGDSVITISSDGIGVNDLASFGDQAFVSWS